MRCHANNGPRLWTLLCLVGCGDNRPGPEVPDASAVDPSPDPGLAFFEMPMLPGYNHASETVVAASGGTIVVLATHQAFPSADSFDYPLSDDDLDHPFRRIAYLISADRGTSYSAPTPLVLAGRSDPVIGGALDGSFWATATDPQAGGATDLLHLTDGATFAPVVSIPIIDKSWIAIDETRQAVWVGGFGVFSLIGFDGIVRAQQPESTFGLSAAYADDIGFHAMSDEDYQAVLWDGAANIQGEGAKLPTGDQATIFTRTSLSMGVANGATWLVRGLHDSASGSPIVARVRRLPDEGHDVSISPPGTVGFLPAAALDPDGRLHVAWYDSSGPFGQLVYAHSETSDLEGAYTQPIVVDGNACPGRGWYPNEDPPGGRRLREYIGIAVTGTRAIISWTHAPDPPSRIRIAHVDF